MTGGRPQCAMRHSVSAEGGARWAEPSGCHTTEHATDLCWRSRCKAPSGTIGVRRGRSNGNACSAGSSCGASGSQPSGSWWLTCSMLCGVCGSGAAQAGPPSTGASRSYTSVYFCPTPTQTVVDCGGWHTHGQAQRYCCCDCVKGAACWSAVHQIRRPVSLCSPLDEANKRLTSAVLSVGLHRDWCGSGLQICG